MSRRSRLHYHLATIGYWASRMMARSPRPEGLPGDSLSFGAAVRYELPSHTTSRQNRHPDLSRRDDSCNCFSLMVTSDRSHKGLSPSITAPCPAHHHAGASLDVPYTTVWSATKDGPSPAAETATSPTSGRGDMLIFSSIQFLFSKQTMLRIAAAGDVRDQVENFFLRHLVEQALRHRRGF